MTKHHGSNLPIFVRSPIRKMKFQNFRQYFSASRINRYLAASGNSQTKALKLYKANLKVSQAFHPLLGVFEVVFRNRLNDVLAAYFTDPDWIINQKSGFMSDPSLTFTYKRTGQRKTNDFLRREITKAEKRLRKSGTPIASGKILAEQTLGFWTDLFEVHHYRLLKGRPIKIFKTLPPKHGRKEVNDELNKIRLFRNRINHNEPICFSGNLVDFTGALEVHQSILRVLNWIDPDLLKFVDDLDKVQKTIETSSRL